MKVIDNLNDFIQKIDNAKKVNQLDLSSDQDLTIAIMNLISIEEHLFFSGAKTKDNSFYDLIENIREYRKELLGKIIKSYKGEVWCISKHLLAGCMRLSEVATKALHANKKEEAYDMFDKAYNLYCLFWGLNLNALDTSETRKLIKGLDKDTNNNVKNEINIDNKENDEDINNKNDTNPDKEKKGFIKSIKDFVTKTVDCCRE